MTPRSHVRRIYNINLTFSPSEDIQVIKSLSTLFVSFVYLFRFCLPEDKKLQEKGDYSV